MVTLVSLFSLPLHSHDTSTFTSNRDSSDVLVIWNIIIMSLSDVKEIDRRDCNINL